MRLLLAALLLFISASASAAGCAGTGNCYWVGGTGNFSDTTHWATTDGGATTGSIPTATDNCNFTANSSTANAAYTATVDASTTCLDFVMAGPGGGNKVTWAGNSALNLSGSMNLSGGTAGITRTFTGQLTFVGTSAGKTVTTGGVDLGGGGFSVNGVGGSWQLQDNLTATNSSLALINGALDTNGKTVAVGNLQHSSTGTVTLSLGASAVNLSGAVTCLNLSLTGLTFNAGTSTITCGTSSTTINLTSGDSYTFNNLAIASNQITTMTLAANQTVGGTLTLTGAAANTRVGVTSNTVGTARTITANAVSLTDVDFTDITGAGAATWSGTRVGDRLGNSGISFTAAVPKFWVGGTGNWSDATNHWATSSGGGPGVNNYPLPQDNAKFDSASNATAYTVTVNQAAFMTDLNFSAAPVTGTITWAASNGSTIQGNFTALSGMVKSGSGANTFAARSSGKTITSNSLAWASTMSFNGPSGAWTLQDDLNIGTNNLTLTNGTLDANGKTITASTLAHTVSNSTMALTLGSSAINLSGGSCFNWTQTGLTVTPGTSTITCSAATTPALTSGDSYTFNNLSMTFTASNTNTFTIGASQTVNGTLTLAGSSATTHPIVQASTAGVATPGAGPYTITANAVSLTDVDFTDITGAGAATWTGTRLGDCKGNSGITFTTGAPKYYVGNTANWNTANVWATASGGAGATNNFPLCQDTANLDAGSFSANGQTLTISAAHRTPGIIASGTDQTYTIAFSAAPSVYGDVTLDANATISGSSALTMVGRNTQTITSAGRTWSAPLTINSPGGTVKFADAYIATDTTTLTRGTLDLNGRIVTTNALSTSNANTRSIKDGVGGGKVITSNVGVSNAIVALVATGLTVDRTNSWTIEIGGNTANARGAFFGPTNGTGPAWPTVTFTNTTASGQLNLTGGGTLKSLVVSNPPQTLNFTAGTVHKIENTNGFPSGTAGNLVTVKSATAGTPFTLAKLNGGGVNVDYVSVKDSAGTPASTWCAGVNSTNGGGNSGWTFNSSACSGAVVSNKANFLPFLQ